MRFVTLIATLLGAVVAPRRGVGSRTTQRIGPAWQVGFSRQSDLEFRRLLDKLPAAAYTCDADGLITYFNDHAVELWGREPRLRHPSDRFCGSFLLFAPDGSPIPHADCWMALALRENRQYNGEEIIIERKDGTRCTVLAHANPLHDRAGRIIGAVNVLVDITDRKRAETVLREADRSKNEFLAMLAHELRNPLAPMHSALRLMRLTDDAAALMHARGTLERQLGHLTRVVDDLLDLARITRNTLELRRERIDLRSVLHQAVETCRPQLESASQALSVNLTDEPMQLDADPHRLAQLFGNLLNNASKYTEARGRVWLTAERQGSDAIVTVRDNGIGIAPEAVARIFDMFIRVDESVQRAHDGLGIGLSLARRVVELHGGTIEASSAGLGMGSEFRVHLPLTIERSRTLGPTLAGESDEAIAVRPRRILIVDDNPDSAESLAELLALSGHETHVAHDGAAAVEAARALRPEVVVLDIGLPKMNGYEAAREIRRQPHGSEVMLVALTGWGQDEDRRKSRDAGFDHHLVKPIDYRVFARLLREAS